MLHRPKLILFFIIGMNVCTQAETYYLDPVAGNNQNDGSINAPWASLQSVIESNMIETRQFSPLPYTAQSVLIPKNFGAPIKAGDTLMLLSGQHGYLFLRGGYNEKPITITTAPGHSPIIEGVKFSAVANWRFENLLISTEPSGNFHNGRLFFIESHGWHGPSKLVTIKNCTVQSIADSKDWILDDWLTKSASGIYFNSDSSTITNNAIHNVDHGITITGNVAMVSHNEVVNFAGDGIRPLGNDLTVQYNLIKNCYDVDDNHDDGIQVFTSIDHPIERMIIRGNVILNFEDADQPFRGPLQGIGCFDGPYVDWVIENNLVVVDHWHGITLMGAFNCDIINNTVIDPTPDERPGPVWIRITDHKNGTPSENCRVINNISNTYTIDALDIGNVTCASGAYDDFFVDATGYDFHLVDGSPAIDAGDTTSAPPADIEGVSRPQGKAIDAGAYEYEFITTSSHNTEDILVEIYPNPTTKSVQFKCHHNSEEMELSIYTLNGVKVFQSPFSTDMQWNPEERGSYLAVIRGNSMFYKQVIQVH